MSSTTSTVAATDITIGEHVTVEFLGITFNLDTIWATALAGLIVIGLGFWVRARITSATPNKVQLVWEAVVQAVTTQVEASLGSVNPFVVPLVGHPFLLHPDLELVRAHTQR